MFQRRFSIGAETHPEGVHFRIWAPDCKTLDVVLESQDPIALQKDNQGYFSGLAKEAKPGMLYRFRLNDTSLIPDPASRYQPQGPHGPSEIVSPQAFSWSDEKWPGIKAKGQSIYELHLGTFTNEGTWRAAMEKLPYLKDLGITIIEIMPIAEFVGDFGWGYDGVNLFAPYHLYGSPHDIRLFIDKAHELGLGVILDVVYNHFGPDGNYLGLVTKSLHNEKHKTDWGKPLNFDNQAVRELIIANAGYWIEEFHFDGLRLDATQNIYDFNSPTHIIAEITQEAHKRAQKRSILIFAENESQESKLISPLNQGGYGVDCAWNDDFHHSARVKLTGMREAYYTDYQGHCQEFLSALKYGYLYQGQHYSWQKKNRGTPSLDNAYHKYVLYLENHDQIANTSTGQRLCQLAEPALFRIMTLLLLLSPQTPLLFQGQEFGATTPFYFFADHKDRLAKGIWEGRKDFLKQFPFFNNDQAHNQFVDPCDLKTFERCKLQWQESNASLLAFHKALLQLRNKDSLFTDPTFLDGAVIGDLLLLRFFGKDDDRLILCNFGNTQYLNSIPEPLFASPLNKSWKLLLSSQDLIYGGIGTSDDTNLIQGHTALVWDTI